MTGKQATRQLHQWYTQHERDLARADGGLSEEEFWWLVECHLIADVCGEEAHG